MADLGRLLLVFGVLLLVIGGALMLFGRFHLPGDFTFRSGNLTVYIPLATSIVLSVVATIVLNLVFRQREAANNFNGLFLSGTKSRLWGADFGPKRTVAPGDVV